MLTTYPIKINNVTIPFPDSWSETPMKAGNRFETEDGGIRQIITRTKRLTASASFTVTSRWLKNFMTYRDANTLSVDIYDPVSGSSVNHTMFIVYDSFTYELIPEFRHASGTEGLWKLSFDLEEV